MRKVFYLLSEGVCMYMCMCVVCCVLCMCCVCKSLKFLSYFFLSPFFLLSAG